MSPRPQQRAPKGHTRDRTDRRAVVDVLLARAQRGALTTAEGALLTEHVREEQRLADATRRAMAGTTRALARHREAADAAIIEAEQRAEAAEQHLAPVEAALAETRRRHHAACQRVDQLLAILARVRDAHSLGDALAAVAEHDGLPPAAARVHARILDRANSAEARLAEQKRDHDIALATAMERARHLGVTMQRTADHHRDRVKAAEQRLAAVRDALPDEPRPRLGLPNDLAYAHGRHDLADAVRDALDRAQL
ncbi:hypothetical protein BJP40_08425 [Streptomyces sp. CC53]|uniref:hypothetical protein n=1 Tax=Streptomyces sp. CC53 TaxID=1906740 RepID=UPI0008DD7226|nr:hypothetical protein [Streptomyces sp. CC53]OII60877.1 hypothetical protein BJP40_08425 [Streptomyces sp. CC53]